MMLSGNGDEESESNPVFHWGGCIPTSLIPMDVSDSSDDIAVGVMEEKHQ